MRSFIAIELPDPIKASLTPMVDRLRRTRVRASWVKPERMHLTLRFLGDVAEERLAALGEHLSAGLSGIEPFPLRVQGVGAFPNTRRPVVLWAGVGSLEGALTDVQAAAERAAQSIGLKPERRAFRAHVTIARVKQSGGFGELSVALRREEDFEAGPFQAGAVTLFSSELAPSGPVYTRLREFPL